MVHLIYDSRCASFEYEIAKAGYIIHGAGRIKTWPKSHRPQHVSTAPAAGEGVKLGQDHGTGPEIPAEGQKGQQKGQGQEAGKTHRSRRKPQEAPDGEGVGGR